VAKLANIQGTDGGSVTIALPADLTLYHARRDLIAKRNAERDPIKRGQINVLIEQLSNYDRATGMQRMALAGAIKAQLNRMGSIQG